MGFLGGGVVKRYLWESFFLKIVSTWRLIIIKSLPVLKNRFFVKVIKGRQEALEFLSNSKNTETVSEIIKGCMVT